MTVRNYREQHVKQKGWASDKITQAKTLGVHARTFLTEIRKQRKQKQSSM